jgi:hypothetical protein
MRSSRECRPHIPGSLIWTPVVSRELCPGRLARRARKRAEVGVASRCTYSEKDPYAEDQSDQGEKVQAATNPREDVAHKKERKGVGVCVNELKANGSFRRVDWPSEDTSGQARGGV